MCNDAWIQIDLDSIDNNFSIRQQILENTDHNIVLFFLFYY